MTRIAFDLYGVIINKNINGYMFESILSLKLAVQKYGRDNIFIISKAKDKYVELNKEYLNNIHFFDNTLINKENLIFCREYEDKAILCKKLNIDYMIDDSLKVAKFILDYQTTKPILFGSHLKLDKELINKIIYIKNWTKFRKFMCKLPK